MKNGILKYLQLGLINIANILAYFIILLSLYQMIIENQFSLDRLIYIGTAIVVITCLIYIKESVRKIYV